MAKESESSSRKSTQIMTHIINIVQKEQSEQTMTSLEIAELTGKQHKDLLRAIRKMEIAWVDVTGRKFALRVKINELANGVKIETLERAHMGTGTPCDIAVRHHMGASPQCALLPAKEVLAMADEIIGEGLRLVNADAEDTLTATQVAKTFNMTVFDFNAVLRDMGIQYYRGGHWNISDDLADRNLVRLRTHVSYSLKGAKKVKVYMTWTLDGVRFLNAKLGYPNF